jgi:hypothetical protein
MPKAQITWKSVSDEGEKREVYATRMGDRWEFYARPGRYDDWQPLEDPSLEDWLELLDGVRRRIPRKWFRPEVEGQLIAMIRARFPEAELEDG